MCSVLRQWFACLLFCNVFIFVFALPADAEDSAKEIALKVLQEKIAQERQVLKDSTQNKKSLEEQIKTIQEEISKAEKEKAEAKEIVDAFDKELANLEATLSSLSSRAKMQKELFGKRAVGVYKLYHRATAFDYLFDAQSSTDLLRRAKYLTFIAAKDKDILSRLAGVLTKLESGKAQIDQLRSDKQKNVAKLEQLESELQAKKQQTEDVIKELRSKEEVQKKTIEALRQHAIVLEKAVAQATGLERKSSEKNEIDLGVKHSGEVKGVSFESLKGKIQYPVSGKISKKFGEESKGEFKEAIFVKGVEFSVSSSADVKVVAQGRVILTRNLPGYGDVVIVDHGNRYYSLYGRLGEITTEQGAEVIAGTVIARSSKSSAGESTLYFELRHKGKAVDPSPFFK